MELEYGERVEYGIEDECFEIDLEGYGNILNDRLNVCSLLDF